MLINFCFYWKLEIGNYTLDFFSRKNPISTVAIASLATVTPAAPIIPKRGIAHKLPTKLPPPQINALGASTTTYSN